MIDWEQNPRRTERGIQMLLRRSHAGLRSFDGAGGDGGRDAQLITADGRTVFEIKSFGRLTSSRRRQVEGSLRAAVASAPDMTRWVLVIPMNMTPARAGARSSEESWFDEKLSGLAPGVDLEWWGQDWIDGQLAEHMDVQRYIEGVDGQLLERAAEFGMEQAVMANGAKDLGSRVGALRRRVDEISPYWTLDFFSRDGMQGTMLRAKTPDAPIQDPIIITPTFVFGAHDPGDEDLRLRFERTLDFGGRVDLPAGYVSDLDVEASPEARLLITDGDPATSQFTLVTTREQLNRPLRCSYQVMSAADELIAEFPVFLRERTAGASGVTLFGSDASEIAKFAVNVPRPSKIPGPEESLTMHNAGLQIDLPDSLAGYDIDSLLPVFRVLSAATRGTSIRFDMPGLGHIGGGPLETAQFEGAAAIQQFVDDIHRMQLFAGPVLRFPANVTNGEVKELRNRVRQLEGEDVEHEGGVTLNLRPESLGPFLQTFGNLPENVMEGGLLFAAEGIELQVGDVTLSYGPVAFWAPKARLTNLAELQQRLDTEDADGPEIQAKFEPTEHQFRWVSRDKAEAYLNAGERPSEPDLTDGSDAC